MNRIFFVALLAAAGAALVLCLSPQSVWAVDTYQLNLSLTGGESAAITELDERLGPEGYGWEKYGGSFTDEGFLLDTRSSLLLRLGNEFPVEHVAISFKAKGIDNEVESLPVGGKDGQLFNMRSTDPDWCREWDPDCTFNKECYEGNWGFGIKKWPDMGGHPYTNSILVQGTGLFNGMAVPNTTAYNWEAQTGFYTVKLTLHAGQSHGSLEVIDPAGNLVGESSEQYGLASLADRDSVEAWIGGEILNGIAGTSYGGVTIKDISIFAGREFIPDDRFIWPPGECPYDSTDEEVDDPDNPYDTCACHAVPDLTAEPPCEDELDLGDEKKVSYMDQFPFSFDNGKLVWNWKLSDIIKETNSKKEQTFPLPDMSIEFAPPAPQPGEDGAALAATLNFRTRMQKMYFGWCMIRDDLVYPMNSIVAGGIELPDLTEPDLSWDDLGCCQPITRIPEEDTDNDGMDDQWERDKFVDRDGTTYTSIEQVLPGDDPDQDGYYANAFENEDGEILTVTPYLIAANPAQTEFPMGDEDAQLTNLEEYILDTDPLDGDSDGDGYGDEMDFIGVGQLQLQFPIDKQAGPEGFYDLSVASIGVNQARKISIVGAKQRLFVGDEGSMEINLSANKEVMTFNDDQTMAFEVALVGGTDSTEELFYEWFFNGNSACDGNEPDFSELCDEGSEPGGIGKRRVVLGEGGISFFDLPEPTSNDYTVSVRAVSPSSRGVDEAEVILPIATAVSLVTADCGDQTEEIDNLTANSEEPVMVCIAEDVDFEGLDQNDLNFIWQKDGIVDSQQSGLGRAEYELLPTKSPGAEHVVSVQVREAADSREIFNSSRAFPIVGPAIEIVLPETTESDPAAGGSTRYTSVEAGQSVFLQAEMSNADSALGYNISWEVGGEASETTHTYDLKPSYTWFVPQDSPQGTVYVAKVNFSSVDLENQAQGSDSIQLVVGDPLGATGLANPFFGELAAVFTKIPTAFQEIVKYAAILAGVFFALVFLYPKFSRWGNKQN